MTPALKTRVDDISSFDGFFAIPQGMTNYVWCGVGQMGNGGFGDVAAAGILKADQNPPISTGCVQSGAGSIAVPSLARFES